MTAPKPNPQWEYTPPAVSKDGRVVRMDAMQWPMVLELYRVFGVKPAQPNAAYVARGRK